MKISIDLDGTLLEKREFFAEFMRLFIDAGHEVGILTGHRQDREEKDREKLRELGFPSPSFYFGRTEEYMPLNGAHYKTMVIEREGIDLHFDDYDYNHPDTIKLFSQSRQEHKIVRLRSADERFAGMRS